MKRVMILWMSDQLMERAVQTGLCIKGRKIVSSESVLVKCRQKWQLTFRSEWRFDGCALMAGLFLFL